MGCEDGYPSSPGRGMERRVGPSPEKKIFHLKWRIFVHSERYFCPCPRQENVDFSA